MQYSIIFVGALASFATTSLAVPLHSRQDNQAGQQTDPEISILLQNSGTGIATQLKADNVKVNANDNNELMKTIQINLPDGFQNQELRCQALSKTGDPFAGKRKKPNSEEFNLDINFSKGEPWEFVDGEVDVAQLVCDGSFKKTDPKDPTQLDTDLFLRNGHTNGFIIGGFLPPAGKEHQFTLLRDPVTNSLPQYTNIEIREGIFRDPQGMRCKIVDQDGNFIVAKRGDNEEESFGDGGKGEWAFTGEVVQNPNKEEATAGSGNGRMIRVRKDLNDAQTSSAPKGIWSMKDVQTLQARKPQDDVRAATSQEGNTQMTPKEKQGAEDQDDIVVPANGIPMSVSAVVCSPEFKKREAPATTPVNNKHSTGDDQTSTGKKDQTSTADDQSAEDTLIPTQIVQAAEKAQTSTDNTQSFDTDAQN